MIKAAIFDLDGTIINTLADLAQAGNNTLKTYGYKTHEVDEYRFFVGSGMRKLCQRILPEDKSKDDEFVDNFLLDFNKYYNEHYMDNSDAYDGIKEMFDNLKEKNIKTGVLTNKNNEFTQPMIKKVFGSYPFSCVLGKTDRFPVKPNKGSVMHVMEEMKVSPSECIYVGDSNVDMKTAQNGEISQIIGVSWGFRPTKELKEAGAKYIVNEPMEIIEIINTLNK